MLTKAGYEVSSIGNDVLPCTLRVGNQPIGFLLDDLSVRLLPDQEKERARLQPIISFAAENQGIEQDQGEYKLSQYQNVILTASFDYESCRPVYNIYSEDQNKEWILLNSSEVKSVATKDFAERSGLVLGEIPAPALEADRILRFMDAVKQKGYQLRENREEAHRRYDITDQDGKEVGYIGKDNRVTITSEDSGVRRALTNTYLDTNPDSNDLLPAFFEKLKESLKGIGMALKVIFTPKGRHYAIHNQQHREVATISEQHEVTYTGSASAEEKARIDALVEELRREALDKEQPETTKEKEAAVPETKRAEVQGPSVSAEEVHRVAEAIFSDPATAETFFQTILSNPEFAARLNERMAESAEISKPVREAPAEVKQETPVQAEKQPEKESPATAKVRQEFERDYSYLQTLFGFNQEKYDALKADMTARFGTADLKEFQSLLSQEKFDRAGTLQGRLESAQRVAELRNSREAAQQKKPKEKERA
jgi:hypothetical protein